MKRNASVSSAAPGDRGDVTNVVEAINDPAGDAVPVSADTLKAVRRAYPNYFLDTRIFGQAVNRAICK